VEPPQIQELPMTAFILVDSHNGHRRIIYGDCNPGTVLLDRVADTPHPHDLDTYPRHGA
jgi:hypothetical protein